MITPQGPRLPDFRTLLTHVNEQRDRRDLLDGFDGFETSRASFTRSSTTTERWK